MLADTKSKARELQTRTQEASKRLLHKAENLTSPTQGARDNDDGATTNESGASTKRVLSFKDMANLPAAMSEQFQDPSGKLKLPQSEVLEREVARFRQRISNRAAKIQARWDDARLVSLRDKVSFLFGVMNVVSACLMVGFRPHWVPWVYTIQAFILLPWRAYSYKKKKYHYFLLDSVRRGSLAARTMN